MSRRRPAVAPAAGGLEIAEHSLRTVIRENLDGMLVIDREGVVLFANPAAERLLSRPGETLKDTRLGVPLVSGQSTEIDVVAGQAQRTAELRVVAIEWESEPALLASLRDVTDRKQAEAKFRGLLESAPDAIVIADERGVIELVNAKAELLFGYDREDLLGQQIELLMPERFRSAHDGHRRGFSVEPHARQMGSGLNVYAQRKDGTEFPIDVTLGPLDTGEGTLVSAAIRDRTEAEELFRQAFDEAPIGMAMLGLDCRFAQVNQALSEITGYSREQLVATSSAAITYSDDPGEEERAIVRVLNGDAISYRSEKRVAHAGGRDVWVAIQTTLLHDAEGHPLRFLAQIQDITERRSHEQRLRYLADHDALTGLINRRSFELELETQRLRSTRYGGGGAVIMLDLDHFKFINDTLGHSAGDETIVKAANVLDSRLRETDILARLGGDEFAVLLPRAGAPAARVVAEELLEALSAETVDLGERVRPLTASAGIALFESEQKLSGVDVLVNADSAMYEAKNAGRARAELYAAGEHGSSRIESRVTWAQRLEKALQHNGFTLLAQPIVDLATGRASQYELLLRMRDERGDLILPGAFLDIAERLGMVQEIDQWVATQAIALLAQSRARGNELTLEVNLSGLSIGDPELLALVIRQLERSKVPPHSLVFEVTETAAVFNMTRAGQFARDLTHLGCRFALDDFGAGYGSFHNLKHLPFDYLKIDGEFVRSCNTSETDRLLIKAAVDVATGMGKRTIAEFVGDDETAQLLARLGVDYGQGFHFGRPQLL